MVLLSVREKYVRTLSCALVLSVAIGFGGCKKKEVTEEAPEEQPAAATPAPKSATPAPQPVVVATPPPAPAATPAPELAPPGVFYLVTSVSVETSDGILGLKPGQLLREVRPGVYRADNNEVTLRPDQVTNDLVIARSVARQDQLNQAAIQQRSAALAAVQPTASAPSSNGLPPAPSQPLPPQQNPKVAARMELIHQKEMLMAEANRLSVSLGAFTAKYGTWDAAAKKSPQAFQLLQQLNALQKRQADLDAQIAATQ
jgi:hypothetical protein